MNFGFIIDNRKCIGCHACTVACKSEHEVPIGVNRTWVKYIEKGSYPNTRRTFTVMRCNHCMDAPCVEICPVTALYTRHDGIVDFDNERCIGCKACTQACPYDALFINPENRTAAKCNYCAHRIEIGLEPACVNVCPEQAIISGDLDSAESEISKLLHTERVQVRKPEKATKPKLFYIEGDEAALSPVSTEQDDNYIWSAQTRGVGHNVDSTFHKADALKNGNGDFDIRSLVGVPPTKPPWWNLLVSPEKARRVYDAPQKGIMWGWEVPAYLWTKSIAAGSVLVPFLLTVFGVTDDRLRWIGALLGLAFLAATGVLLIMDLDRPDRFLNVLFRPQWRSWLVRGAYTISAYGGLITLWMLLKILGLNSHAEVVGIILVPFAALSAMYTSFLFAQARGRDYWQNPMLPVQMLLHSLMSGSAILVIAIVMAGSIFISPVSAFLFWATTAHLLLTTIEMLTQHPTHDAQLAARMISQGKYKGAFWLGVILAGNTIPLLILSLLSVSTYLVVASLCVLAGVALSNYLTVRVPQLIPLS